MALSNARKKLIRLIQKYLTGKASQAEAESLDAYYDTFDASREGSPGEEDMQSLGREMKSAIWEKIDRLEQQRTPVAKRLWVRMAVAAGIVVLAGIPVYYFIIGAPRLKTIVKASHQPVPPAHDALPGGNKATLTLADGSVIDLDNAANGEIAKQGETSVSKRLNGQLEYRKSNSPALSAVEGTTIQPPSYNTLSTPKGGQYFLELPDGSKVWLNAASSIRYPTAFTGNERVVELTGEAYFEIMKNHDKPFRVHVTSPSTSGEGREGMIEVLGTHFNVNAYQDEAAIKTTLLEGSVKIVNHNKRSVILKPGEQATISQTSQLSHPIPVDTEEAIAWKNGLFYFDNVDIQAIMRQVARWYKVQVVFKGHIPARRFAGQVSRNSNLSQVLKILELSKVHFTIEGETVTVLP